MKTGATMRGVYPPSFCRWRLLLAVMGVTQVSVLLIGLGRLQSVGLPWLGITTLYAQSLALMTAMSVCVVRAWLGRLSPRGAWLGSWIVAVLTAALFSYMAGIIGTVSGIGPGRAYFELFVLQSTIAVALVSVALFRYLFIRAQWQVSELPKGASVLPFTLQPLLENAVAHGIQPRVDGGEVRVYGRSENDKIVITICNPLAPDPDKSRGASI